VIAAATATASAENYKLVTRICDQITNSMPDSERGLSAVFGPVLSRKEDTLPNPHDPHKVERLLTLEFSHASATIWMTEGPGMGTVVELNVRVGGRLPGLDIVPGTEVALLKSRLGDPAERSGNNWDYACSDEVGPTLRFAVRGHVVERLSWINYPD